MRMLPLGVLLVACGPSGSLDIATSAGDGTGGLPPTAELPLEDRIRTDALMGHLEALQAIADANNDNRAAGTSGYAASVDYAIEVLEAAGYEVQRDPFSYSGWTVHGPSALEVLDDPSLVFEDGQDIEAMTYSDGGDVTAPLAAVDLVLPPTASSSSTSGCESADFDGFVAGHIALLQRGECYFDQKAQNAQAAGASAVILFNEGQVGRQDLEGWQLDAETSVTIPVLSASFETGNALAALLEQGPTSVRVFTDSEVLLTESENLIAETADGDPDRVVVVGGHLDSVLGGPGINDNGSGVATILEMAVQLAEGAPAQNRIRFSLWGAEEVGLLGSSAYVEALSDQEAGRIIGKLNFDMVASINGTRMVYDGDGDYAGMPGPSGSAEIEQVFLDWFDGEGLASTGTAFDGRSDYLGFILRGIAAGGLFSGAEGLKTVDEAQIYGGTPGAPRDPCYHAACDTIDNIDPVLFEELARAASYTSWALANTTPSWTDNAAAEPHQRPLEVGGHCSGHAPVRW